MESNASITVTADGIIILYNKTQAHDVIRYDDKIDPTRSLRYERLVREFKSQNLNNIQEFGTRKRTKFQHFEDEYSYEQVQELRKCLYGRRTFSDEQWKKLGEQENGFQLQLKINQNHKKTQRLINLSKWKYTIQITKKFFEGFERLKPALQKFISVGEEIIPEDNDEINYLPLSVLKRESLVQRLYELGILPQNFYQL